MALRSFFRARMTAITRSILHQPLLYKRGEGATGLNADCFMISFSKVWLNLRDLAVDMLHLATNTGFRS